MTTNRQRKREQRARDKAARAERRRDPERPDRTVCEQYGRPITRESIEDEMRRRGLLR